MKTATLVMCAGLAATPALAANVGGTSFEDSPLAPQTTTNAGVAPGTGEMTGPGLSFAGSVNEVGFRTFWTDTRGTGAGGPVDGAESGDFIGVTDFTPAFGTPFTDGVNGYEFNDTDGQIELRLDTINTAGSGDLTVSFDVWFNATTWEANDSFSAVANGAAIYSVSGAAIDPIEGVWTSLSFGIGSASTLDLSFFGDNNSGAENIFIDNIRVSGLVPTPGPATLFAAAGLVGLRRRRSR